MVEPTTMRPAAIILMLALLLAGCGGYGGETIRSDDADGGRIVSNGEHCALTLPVGWTWLPASWVATSPLGTRMAFDEELYGRPQYASWEEARDKLVADAEGRANSTVTWDDDSVQIDYGDNAGLVVLQRFDRVGCKVTFANARSSRAQELPVWETIVQSLERTSPTPEFTPPPG